MTVLTDAELRAMDLITELWNLLSREIVTDGPAREQDLTELCAHVHVLQATVLSQGAARAYPDRFRVLGGTH